MRLEQHFVDELADQVTGQDVALLNARRFFRKNANGAVGEILHCAAGSAGQRHGVDGFCLCRLECPQHVAGVSVGGNARGNITGFAQRLKLSCEYAARAALSGSAR